MRRHQQPITKLPTGSSRIIDLALEYTGVAPTLGATGLNNRILNLRSGLVELAALTIAGGVYDYYQGRLVVAIPPALNNGFAWVKGLPVTTVRPPRAGSLELRGARVTRFLASMACETLTPNADMGTSIVVAGSSVGAVTDLFTSNGTGSSKSGFGVHMIGNAWTFFIKKQGLASGQFTELVPLGLGNDGSLIDTEFRILDATFAQEAKLELWIRKQLALTRYWVNPPGVNTATLPAFATTLSGAQLYMQHRNTTVATGPVYIADPGIIAGTADSGTF
jgi:hypothetical protein